MIDPSCMRILPRRSGERTSVPPLVLNALQMGAMVDGLKTDLTKPYWP
jgi:hypothetical protein